MGKMMMAAATGLLAVMLATEAAADFAMQAPTRIQGRRL